MIGVHQVTMTAPTRAAVDLSALVDQVTIRHGREDPADQPEASTATVELSWRPDLGEVLPPDVEIGGVLGVSTTLAGATFTRFVGRVTDVNAAWDSDGSETPDRPTAQVVAAGVSADLGRRVVGDAPFPQELDGARVQRVLNLAGLPWDPATSDPGTVQILPRDIDSQPALDVIGEVAGDAAGVLWETRDGDVRYADSEHRRGATVALLLDASDVLVTPQWVRTLSGLVNDVSIGYGPDPDEGEQPRVYGTNQPSVDAYGRYFYTTGTQLAAQADAEAMAALLLGRNAYPAWRLAALPVDMTDLDLDRSLVLLGLEMHDLIQVTGLPGAGTTPTSTALWVEGWTETLAWGVHAVELNVSGYCRTVPAPRWDDLDPATTWDSIGTLSWDEAGCMGPPISYGRWADVPATTRWDQVDPATTWDTWEAATYAGNNR